MRFVIHVRKKHLKKLLKLLPEGATATDVLVEALGIGLDVLDAKATKTIGFAPPCRTAGQPEAR